MQLVYQRDGKQSTVQVKPSYSTADGTGRWMIGVQLERPIIITKLGFGEALRESVDQNIKGASLIYQFFQGLDRAPHVGEIYRRAYRHRPLIRRCGAGGTHCFCWIDGNG